jgi:hypothetical protein
MGYLFARFSLCQVRASLLTDDERFMVHLALAACVYESRPESNADLLALFERCAIVTLWGRCVINVVFPRCACWLVFCFCFSLLFLFVCEHLLECLLD